jgi:hypothetical protein
MRCCVCDIILASVCSLGWKGHKAVVVFADADSHADTAMAPRYTGSCALCLVMSYAVSPLSCCSAIKKNPEKGIQTRVSKRESKLV